MPTKSVSKGKRKRKKRMSAKDREILRLTEITLELNETVQRLEKQLTKDQHHNAP